MYLVLSISMNYAILLACILFILSILTCDVGLTFSRNTIPFVFEIVKFLGPLRRSLKVQCVLS